MLLFIFIVYVLMRCTIVQTHTSNLAILLFFSNCYIHEISFRLFLWLFSAFYSQLFHIFWALCWRVQLIFCKFSNLQFYVKMSSVYGGKVKWKAAWFVISMKVGFIMDASKASYVEALKICCKFFSFDKSKIFVLDTFIYFYLMFLFHKQWPD